MNDAEPELDKSPPPTQEIGGDLWVRLEGGVEDNTSRPHKIPKHRSCWEGTPHYRPRSAAIQRETAETKIELKLDLDGTGKVEIATGVGFFDHMLTLLAKHSLIDLTVKAAGDLHVDPHHTVEDVGICFGKGLAQALGDKAGIRRYGSATLPMDEVLVTAAIDLSGRPFCVWQADVPRETLGTFNAPLAEEFWRAVSSSGAFNLHVLCHYGRNTHHIVEGIFKASARALRQAVESDPRMPGVPSTKGVL